MTDSLIEQLQKAKEQYILIETKLHRNAKVIGEAFAKRHGLKCNEFIFQNNSIIAYISGPRIDDVWEFDRVISVPSWAFNNPHKYIEEEMK